MTPKQIWKQHYGNLRAEFEEKGFCGEEYDDCLINGRVIDWGEVDSKFEVAVVRPWNELYIAAHQEVFERSADKPKRSQFRSMRDFLNAYKPHIEKMQCARVLSQKMGFKLP